MQARRRSRALASAVFVTLVLATATALAALALHVRVTAAEDLVKAANLGSEERGEASIVRRCCNEQTDNSIALAIRGTRACSADEPLQVGGSSNSPKQRQAALDMLSRVPVWARQCVSHCLVVGAQDPKVAGAVPTIYLAVGTHALAIAVPYTFLILFRYNRDKLEDAALSSWKTAGAQHASDGSDYSRVGLI